MSERHTPDAITIRLGSCAGTDAFGLDLSVDGAGALVTVEAAGPGLFRSAPLVRAGAREQVRAGWILGFLQRGPLLMPVTAPCDGWLLARAPEGARVEHGTPLFRLLGAREGITP